MFQGHRTCCKRDLDIKIGFAKSGVKIPFRINGKKQTLPNELQFNMGLVIRDNKTVQQRIGEKSTVTDGIRIFRLSPTLDYSVSDKLQISLYFERNVNNTKSDYKLFKCPYRLWWKNSI